MNVKLQILSIKNAPRKALLPPNWSIMDVQTEKKKLLMYAKKKVIFLMVIGELYWGCGGGSCFLKRSCEEN